MAVSVLKYNYLNMNKIQNQRIDSICDSMEIDWNYEEVLEHNATADEINHIKDILNDII